MRLFEAGQFEEALSPLNRYVATVKNDPEPMLAFAKCRLLVELPNQRHVDAAIAAAKLATDEAPDDPAAWEFLLSVYTAVKRHTETLDACAVLLAIEPSHRGALEWRARALIALGRIDEALDAADEFIAAYPNEPVPHSIRVRALEAQGAAAEQVDAYLRSKPVARALRDEPRYHLMLAVREAAWLSPSAADPVHLERAIADVRRALELRPLGLRDALDATEILRQLGVVSNSDSLRDEAERVIDTLVAEGSLGVAFAAAESRRAWWRFETDRARTLAARINPDADDADAVGWRSFLLRKHETTEIAGGDPAERFWTGLTRAQSLLDQEAQPAAIKAALDPLASAATVLDSDPGLRDHADLVALLHAEALFRAGLLDSADAVVTGATRESGERERARLQTMRVQISAARGEIQRAEGIFASLEPRGITLDLSPATTQWLPETVLLEAEREDNAARAAERLPEILDRAERSPQDPRLAMLAAQLAFASGESAMGIEEARRLLTLAPPPSMLDLAELARRVHPVDPSLAWELLDLAGPIDGAPLPIVVVRAEFEALRSNPGDGLAVLDASADRLASPAFAAQRAAFIERHQLSSAVTAFEEASERYADSAILQSAVLESEAAWSDPALIRNAIARLREAAGDSTLEWRIASLEADLRFPGDSSPGAPARDLSRIILDLKAIADRLPTNTRVLRLISKAFWEAESPDQSVRALQKAASLDAACYPELIAMLREIGRADQAATTLRAFGAVDATSLRYQTLRERALLLEAAGEFDAAINDWIRLARIGRPEDLAALGLRHARMGQTSESQRVARSLAQHKGSPEAIAAATRILAASGLHAQADEVFIGFFAERMGEAVARIELARIFISTQAWNAALSQIHLAEAADTTHDEAEREIQRRILRLHCLLESGRLAEAIEELEESPEDSRTLAAMRAGFDAYPSAPALVRALASAAVRFDEPHSALARTIESSLLGEIEQDTLDQQLRAIVRDAPNTELAWRVLLEIAAENPQRVIELASDAVRTLRAAWPWRMLVDAHIRLGDLDAADKAAIGLTSLDAVGADLLRGRIAALRGSWDLTLTWMRPHTDAIASGQGSLLDAAVLVRALARDGDADAVSRLIEARAAHESGAESLFIDGALEIAARDTDRARDWLTRAITADPREHDGLVLASAWTEFARRTGDRDDARRAVSLFEETASELPPRESLTLISAELLAGAFESAARHSDALDAALPDDPMLINDHAFLLATAFDRPKRGLSRARRALITAQQRGLPPDAIAAIRHTIAASQRALGKTDEAEKTLREAIRECGRSTDLVIELAELLIGRGAKNEAEQISRALSVDSAHTAAQRARIESIRARLR